MKENKSRSIMLITAVFISALFTGNFYLYLKFSKAKKAEMEHQALIQNLKNENNMLNQKLNYKHQDVSYLKEQNKILDKMVEKQKSKPKKKKQLNKEKDQNA